MGEVARRLTARLGRSGQSLNSTCQDLRYDVIERPLFYINCLLLAFVVLSSALVITALAAPPPSVEAITVNATGGSDATTVSIPEAKPLSHYLNAFGKRGLFKSPGSGTVTATPTKTVPDGAETAAKLSLLGIVFDEEDPVAIIMAPGSESGGRYRVGEEIMGLKIDSVNKNSVTLTDGQQQFELKL